MGLKGKAKEILGLMRAKIFGVTAGQNVYIGKHCSLKGKRHIVGNVKIGKHCVIGANSVVTHNVPDYSVAVGSPAKVIKKCDK